MTSDKDYYKILGVPETAGEADIKKAFHRLAKEFHPDLHPEDRKTEAKFKEITEAYDILSDAKKRAEYDNLRRFGSSTPQGGPFVYSQDFPQGSSWESVFGTGVPGGMEEIFEQFFGRSRTRRSSVARGADIQTEISIPFEISVTGGKKRMDLRYPDGKTKSVDIAIPAGIEDKATIRLRGLGQPGIGGGSPGDLIVQVDVEKHRFFKRSGIDILADVHINLKQSILGTKIRIKTPQGEKIDIKVPEGTQPGDRLRVKGKGVASDREVGDFYIVIHVDLPKKLSQSAKARLEEFLKEANL